MFHVKHFNTKPTKLQGKFEVKVIVNGERTKEPPRGEL